MELGDLIYLVAFVAWILSGVLGRAAKKRLAPSAPQPAPRAESVRREPRGRRRLIEDQGPQEADEQWSEPAATARPARLAPTSSLPPPPPSVIARRASRRPLPHSATPTAEAAGVVKRDPRQRELARAIVLAEVLDRPVALR